MYLLFFSHIWKHIKKNLYISWPWPQLTKSYKKENPRKLFKYIKKKFWIWCFYFWIKFGWIVLQINSEKGIQLFYVTFFCIHAIRGMIGCPFMLAKHIKGGFFIFIFKIKFIFLNDWTFEIGVIYMYPEWPVGIIKGILYSFFIADQTMRTHLILPFYDVLLKVLMTTRRCHIKNRI